MADQTHQAKVIRGRLVFIDPEMSHNAISALESKNVTVCIAEYKESRSGQQNRYYWGVVVPIFTDGLIDTGYQVTASQAHEFIKSEFCTQEIVNVQTGEVKNLPGSTTELNTFEFCTLVHRIQIWAAEYLGVIIPDPITIEA